MYILLFLFWVILNGKINLEITIIGLILCTLVYAFACFFLEFSFKKDLAYCKGLAMLIVYGVFLTIWMYSTPILYPIDTIPTQLQPIFRANPLYIFIDFLRTITLDGNIPQVTSFLYCALWGIGMFIIGVIVFIKTQDEFIYYS